MKRVMFALAACVVLGSIAAAAFAESRAEYVDPLSGLRSAEGLPDGWYGFSADNASVSYDTLRTGGPNGEAALVIECKGEYGGAVGTRFPLDRARRYIASVAVKVEGAAGGAASVKIDYYDGAGNYLTDTPVSVPVGTEGWQTISVMDNAASHPDAAEVAISLLATSGAKATFVSPMMHSRPVDADTLLPNGGVEAVAAGGVPVGWALSDDGSGEATMNASTENPADGRFSLHLRTRGVQWATAAAIAEPIEVDPAASYRLTGRARAGGGTVQLAIIAFDGDQYINHQTTEAAGEEWTELSMWLNLDEFPGVTHISPAAFGSGDMEGWFDEVRLIKK